MVIKQEVSRQPEEEPKIGIPVAEMSLTDLQSKLEQFDYLRITYQIEIDRLEKEMHNKGVILANMEKEAEAVEKELERRGE